MGTPITSPVNTDSNGREHFVISRIQQQIKIIMFGIAQPSVEIETLTFAQSQRDHGETTTRRNTTYVLLSWIN